MRNGIQVSLAGNMATDVDRRLANGVPVADFRVAVSRRRKSADGTWEDAGTSFLTVTCWRALAQNVAFCLKKGDPVVVTGSLTVKTREAEGRTFVDVEVTADTVGPDLSWGTISLTRSRQGGSADAGEALAGSREGGGGALEASGSPLDGDLDSAAGDLGSRALQDPSDADSLLRPAGGALV